VLRELLRQRSPLAAMEKLHAHLGNAFQITLPSFNPIVLSGPELNRQALISERDRLSWRGESDPVVTLLRHGVLVTDGAEHDQLRQLMEPALRRRETIRHIPAMIAYTDRELVAWPDEGMVDMLEAMRRVALLILIGALFGDDFGPHMNTLWEPVLKLLKYISPGAWIVWPRIPRPGYRAAIEQVDSYLYALIRQRRDTGPASGDLLDHLLQQPEMDDGLIRDQLLTMLIAGHDTSTASLAWTLLQLGRYPHLLARAKAEVDDVCARELPTEEMINDLVFLDSVIKETLRLYPPIHVGNRFAMEDLCMGGYQVPANTRVMVSIYLTQRDGQMWERPEQFQPERFARDRREERPALAYIPFGGGPRNCIGAAFAQIEIKIVLARLLQQFDLQLAPGQRIRARMGATLEPYPAVKMFVKRRR
jgi:cytochrome P450